MGTIGNHWNHWGAIGNHREPLGKHWGTIGPTLRNHRFVGKSLENHRESLESPRRVLLRWVPVSLCGSRGSHRAGDPFRFFCIAMAPEGEKSGYDAEGLRVCPQTLPIGFPNGCHMVSPLASQWFSWFLWLLNGFPNGFHGSYGCLIVFPMVFMVFTVFKWFSQWF